MNIPLTLAENKAGLLKKKFSAVELVDAYLARIKVFDEKIGSFLTVTEDKAYSDAKKVDKKLATLGELAFKESQLLGVCIAHKDLFLTKGIRTTAASQVLANYYPSYSATVVNKLENAGTVLLGKTNCDAWAHGASGENSDFKPTKNPWNTSYVPGGSSSGSAAAVAANFSLLATGTDTGGSIRQPSNFCSVVGLKPTYGAVSRYGIIAMASSLDSIGHMARTVEDVETVFNITRGKDGKDATLKDDYFEVKKGKKLKLGVPKEYFSEGLDKSVEKNVREVITTYKKLGVEIVDISLPRTKNAISVYYIVMPAEVSSNLGRYDGVRYGNVRDTFGDEAKRRIMLGTYVLSAGYYDAYYLKAMQVRSLLIKEFDDAFKKVDALIAPVSPTPPFKLGEKASDPLQMYLADTLTVAANLAGIPGLAIPSGFTQNNLPLGFQLLGTRFSESILFHLGKMYQKEVDWKPVVASL